MQTGDWNLFFENGGLWMSGPYVRGERHGVWTTQYETGVKESSGLFSNGRRTGMWEFWSVDGLPDTARSGEYDGFNKAEPPE